jgi:hypothetical protein
MSGPFHIDCAYLERPRKREQGQQCIISHMESLTYLNHFLAQLVSFAA